MKEYILKGDASEVDKVLRENRIRISRGLISITPVEPDAAPAVSGQAVSPGIDEKHTEIEDTLEVDIYADDKTPKDNDVKLVDIEDEKGSARVKKTARRSKKSE